MLSLLGRAQLLLPTLDAFPLLDPGRVAAVVDLQVYVYFALRLG